MEDVASNPKTSNSHTYIEALGSHMRFFALWAAAKALMEYLDRLYQHVAGVIVPSSEFSMYSSQRDWAAVRLEQHGRTSSNYESDGDYNPSRSASPEDRGASEARSPPPPAPRDRRRSIMGHAATRCWVLCFNLIGPCC